MTTGKQQLVGNFQKFKNDNIFPLLINEAISICWYWLMIFEQRSFIYTPTTSNHAAEIINATFNTIAMAATPPPTIRKKLFHNSELYISACIVYFQFYYI